MADCIPEVSQYAHGGFTRQMSSFRVEMIVRREERGGAVFVDAPSSPLMTTAVQNTSMTAFS